MARKSLAERSPCVAIQFDLNKNNGLTAHDIFLKDERDENRKVIKRWWNCHNCARSWQASVASREKNQNAASMGKCEECIGLRTSFGQEAFTISFIYLLNQIGLIGDVKSILYKGRKELDIVIYLDGVLCSKIFAIEYDGYLAHLNKLEKDLEKHIETRSKYHLIHVREYGLPSLKSILHAYDITEIDSPSFAKNQHSKLNLAILKSFEHFFDYLNRYTNLSSQRLVQIKRKIDESSFTFNIKDFESEIIKKLQEIPKERLLIENYSVLAERYSNKNSISIFFVSYKENVERIWDCPNCKKSFIATTNSYVSNYETSKNKDDYTGCPYCNGKQVLLCESFAVLYRDTSVFQLALNGMIHHGFNTNVLFEILSTSDMEVPICCEKCGYGQETIKIHKISNLTKLILSKQERGDIKKKVMRHTKQSACPVCNERSKNAESKRLYLKYLKSNLKPDRFARQLRKNGEKVSAATISRIITTFEKESIR